MAAIDFGKYTEASIKSLDWREHIRLRPGMYIGKLGDGSALELSLRALVNYTSIANSISLPLQIFQFDKYDQIFSLKSMQNPNQIIFNFFSK